MKEVLGHVCDTERIFAYRALRISRGDRTPIEGFEQDDYVRNGPRVPLAEIIEDYIAVRRATLTLLRNLDEQAWTRRGIANQKEVTVRALAYIDRWPRTPSSPHPGRKVFPGQIILCKADAVVRPASKASVVTAPCIP